MSTKEKLLKRFLSKPKDFTYNELKTLLSYYGYEEFNKGKTSGSRVVFYNSDTGHTIFVHKPHPGNIINSATLKDVVRNLKEMGVINEN